MFDQNITMRSMSLSQADTSGLMSFNTDSPMRTFSSLCMQANDKPRHQNHLQAIYPSCGKFIIQ
jgi:hypothetical protein